MLRTVLLKKTQSLNLFSELFASYTYVKLPIDYLKKAKVYFFYHSAELVGGYAIITSPPFRFLQLIPKHIQASTPFLLNNSLENMYEINGLFVINKKFLFEIIKSLLVKILTLKQNYLLLFHNANNQKINNTWHKNLNPHKIYQGKPNTENNNLTSHENIFFGYVERKSIECFLNKIIALP